tara:strand:+ start:4402 stop:6102 length:1701 start_codon:yes stop_codon:yes gene_type:complete
MLDTTPKNPSHTHDSLYANKTSVNNANTAASAAASISSQNTADITAAARYNKTKYADIKNPPSAYENAYEKRGHNHDASYFPHQDVSTKITNQVNNKWGSTSIGRYQTEAKGFRDDTVTHESDAKTSLTNILADEVAAKTARIQAELELENAVLASDTSKITLKAIQEDYKKIVALGMTSQQVARIIGKLALHSKVLNSTIRTSAHLSNAPFDVNNIDKDNVRSVITEAIKSPLKNIGEFSYKGYTKGDYEKDITDIGILDNAINTDFVMDSNYNTYADNLDKGLKNYKSTDAYDTSLLGNIKNILPDALIEQFSNIDGFRNIDGFNNMGQLCGVEHYKGGINIFQPAISPGWDDLNEGDRVKMCNAYHDKSESNENITELEELLAQKKNLASDVMLNYIINEDNENQSTIKQVYDNINDENNLKLRKIKDKEYTNKKNIDNLKILKFAILLFLISVPFLMLHKKEIISINLLFFIIFGLIIIFVIFSGTIIYKQMGADKFNYNKINKTIDNLNTIKKTNNNRGTEQNLNNNNNNKFSSVFGCFKSDCCDDGTVYNSVKGKCDKVT